VWLTNTVAQGLDVRAGGTVTTETVLSASASCAGLCGAVTIAGTGRARVIVTQLLAAYSVALSTEAGAIIAVNAGVDVALDISLTSVSGPVTLSNFLQLHSNNTLVRTGGSVTASAVFANVLDIRVTDVAKVAVTVAFVGLPPPDPADTTDIPFNPKFVEGQNYSFPGLYISSDRGDVSVLSLSGDPRAASNSATGSLERGVEARRGEGADDSRLVRRLPRVAILPRMRHGVLVEGARVGVGREVEGGQVELRVHRAALGHGKEADVRVVARHRRARVKDACHIFVHV
jgi:hypothetical protein